MKSWKKKCTGILIKSYKYATRCATFFSFIGGSCASVFFFFFLLPNFSWSRSMVPSFQTQNYAIFRQWRYIPHPSLSLPRPPDSSYIKNMQNVLYIKIQRYQLFEYIKYRQKYIMFVIFCCFLTGICWYRVSQQQYWWLQWQYGATNWCCFLGQSTCVQFIHNFKRFWETERYILYVC
jgi:hypothetical protein